MNNYLETARVRLREFSLDDEENLYLLDLNPNVMKYISLGKPTAREDIISMIKRVQNYSMKFNGKLGCWIAEDKESLEFLGWFHLRPDKREPDNLKRLELGYRLKQECWGKGIATEVSKELVKKGFCELNAAIIFATAMKTNIASQVVMEKVGMNFIKEYLFKHYDEWVCDAVEFAITKEDYKIQ